MIHSGTIHSGTIHGMVAGGVQEEAGAGEVLVGTLGDLAGAGVTQHGTAHLHGMAVEPIELDSMMATTREVAEGPCTEVPDTAEVLML